MKLHRVCAAIALGACVLVTPMATVAAYTPEPKATAPPPGAIRYDDAPDTTGERFRVNSRWSSGNVTWFLRTPSLDFGITEQRAAFRAAASTWEQATTGLRLSEAATADSADIVIDFEHRDGPNNNLAWAYYPAHGGHMRFDEDETWTTAMRTSNGQPIDLLTVAIHEFGHALGLEHSDDVNAVMYAWYAGSRRTLGDDDRHGIQALYGIAPSNDAFAAALPLGSTPSGRRSGSTAGASHEAGEPSIGNVGGASVWFRWTAPGSGALTVDTCGSDFDTLLGVYRTPPGAEPTFGSLAVLGVSDDSDACGLDSVVHEVRVASGDTVSISVDGFGGQAGNYQLNWTFTGDAAPPRGIAIADARASEGKPDKGKKLNFEITVPSKAVADMRIRCVTSNGTAVAGEDFVHLDTTVVLKKGAKSATCAVRLIGDRVAEADETFIVRVEAPGGGTATARGTIKNDD